MNRRRLLTILLTAAAAGPMRVESQTQERVRRIGVLLATSRSRPNIERLLVPFDQALRARGWVEGRNLVIEWREGHGRAEPLPALAAELVALKVELIVAGATHPAVAASKATRSTPIVFVAAGDPVAFGLVRSLARPGGNVTGFATLSPATTIKGLELLREVVPRLARLSVLHTPGDTASVMQVAALREASAALGLQVELHAVTKEADLESAFRAIQHGRPDGLQVMFTPVTYGLRKRIADFAIAQRVPAVYGYVEFVEEGGLMSYGFSYADNWRRTADYVDRILKGAKPADLPVQQPTVLEMAVNLKTARALGITMPGPIVLRADRIIDN